MLDVYALPKTVTAPGVGAGVGVGTGFGVGFGTGFDHAKVPKALVKEAETVVTEQGANTVARSGRGGVALDTNAIIPLLEGTTEEVRTVTTAIVGRSPSVSITAPSAGR